MSTQRKHPWTDSELRSREHFARWAASNSVVECETVNDCIHFTDSDGQHGTYSIAQRSFTFHRPKEIAP